MIHVYFDKSFTCSFKMNTGILLITQCLSYCNIECGYRAWIRFVGYKCLKVVSFNELREKDRVCITYSESKL